MQIWLVSLVSDNLIEFSFCLHGQEERRKRGMKHEEWEILSSNLKVSWTVSWTVRINSRKFTVKKIHGLKFQFFRFTYCCVLLLYSTLHSKHIKSESQNRKNAKACLSLLHFSHTCVTIRCKTLIVFWCWCRNGVWQLRFNLYTGMREFYIRRKIRISWCYMIDCYSFIFSM